MDGDNRTEPIGPCAEGVRRLTEVPPIAAGAIENANGSGT